jgi:flavodoxin
MSNKLVAYFSASGVTAGKAKAFAAAAGLDIYEIKPVTPYTKADLNYLNPLSRSTKEMKLGGKHPEIVTGDIDISAYDVIFVGYPVWWYVAPTVINSFLEAYDFSGKKIVLFATSGGSGLGKSAQKLEPSAPHSEIVDGFMLNGSFNDEQLKALAGRF